VRGAGSEFSRHSREAALATKIEGRNDLLTQLSGMASQVVSKVRRSKSGKGKSMFRDCRRGGLLAAQRSFAVALLAAAKAAKRRTAAQWTAAAISESVEA
jgi:hypothetical protein